MTDEQKIRRIVQEEMRKGGSKERFNLQATTNHTHNGIDSRPIYSPTFTYAGYVPYEGVFDVIGGFLPPGWQLTRLGAGQYEIVHNLGTSLYSCVVTAAQSTNQIVSAVVTPLPNVLYVFWFLSSSGVGQDTSFMFSLTQINNRASSAPNYTVIGLS